MSAPLSPEDARVLESLISWWEQAGVETLPALPAAAPPRAPVRRPPPAAPSPERVRPAAAAKPEQDARAMAAGAHDLDALKAALQAYEGCLLRLTATQLVFARGNPQADVMIVGEAPGRDEDIQGAPFVGRSGQLLDRMLAAIGLDESSVYITNTVFWRPPGNRKPSDSEIEACRPFAARHIELVRPKVLVFAGGIAAQAMLRESAGIMKLRGRWTDYALEDGSVIPALPMYHPAFLLRRPQEKAKAWADLLSLKSKLEG